MIRRYKDLKEITVISMEECGELIQALSKCFRTEFRKDMLKNLSEEVGDVEMMISLLKKRGLINNKIVVEQKRKRKEKLKKWSNIHL